MKQEPEFKSKVLMREKILRYYTDFFEDRISLSDISKKPNIGSVEFIYDVLMKEFKKRSKKILKDRKEEIYGKIKDIDKNLNINEIYEKSKLPKFEIIEPKKIIDRDDGKQEVIYESKLNKND